MTELRKEAIDIIENMPDTKIVYVVRILKNLSSIFHDENPEKAKSPSPAYMRLLHYKGTVDMDSDTKAELAKARDEKYADFI